jgi:hypothetical protein
MSLTRRSLLASVSALAIYGSSSSLAESISIKRPLVGAIRWDAWYAPGSVVTTAVQKTLAPADYRWRLPFFAEAHSNAPPTFPTASRPEIELEIRQAEFAGLDYWAFLSYGEGDPMSLALSQYLSVTQRKKLRFCLFTEVNRWGSINQPAPLISEHIKLFSRPDYVRVQDNRPLYYLGFIDHKSTLERWKSPEGLEREIKRFRQAAIDAGVGNPYVVLAGTASELNGWATLGGDAVGAYAISDPRGAGPYSALVRLVEQRWEDLSKPGLPVVPTVVAGWDRRPRVEHPVPWEHSQKPGAGMQYYFAAPTPAELSAHLRHALDFIARRSEEKRAPTVLIYAWNENDEGGWLVPTAPCNTERLQALHTVLANASINPECKIVVQ